MYKDIDKIKIVNKSSREIPEELYEDIINGSVGQANDVCSEYNLKIIELDKEGDSLTFIIGDKWS